jgi:hypothetical protein
VALILAAFSLQSHNEELHNFHSSQYVIRMVKSRRMRWIWHVAHMEKRGLLRKPEGKRSVGKPGRRWKAILK